MTSTIYPASTAGISLPLMAGGVISFASFYGEMTQAFFTLRWGLLFITILVITDLWAGSLDNVRFHKESFRTSRAIRRSIVKFMEYINYIIFGFLLAKSISEPLGLMDATGGAALGSMAALAAEANSIYGHFCSLHGYKNPPSIKRILRFLFLRKKEDVIDAIEESLEDDKPEDKHNS